MCVGCACGVGGQAREEREHSVSFGDKQRDEAQRQQLRALSWELQHERKLRMRAEQGLRREPPASRPALRNTSCRIHRQRAQNNSSPLRKVPDSEAVSLALAGELNPGNGGDNGEFR